MLVGDADFKDQRENENSKQEVRDESYSEE